MTEQKLIHDMVGRDVSLFYQRARVPVGDEVVLEARQLTGNGVEGVSFRCAGVRSSASREWTDREEPSSPSCSSG